MATNYLLVVSGGARNDFSTSFVTIRKRTFAVVMVAARRRRRDQFIVPRLYLYTTMSRIKFFFCIVSQW